MTDRQNPLELFRHQPVVALTTFRRSGEGVTTPVNAALDGAVLYVKTWSTSGKMKRIRHTPRVMVAPSTFRGRETGERVTFRAHLVAGEEAKRARALIDARHPILHRILVPVAHRFAGYETVFLRLEPDEV